MSTNSHMKSAWGLNTQWVENETIISQIVSVSEACDQNDKSCHTASICHTVAALKPNVICFLMVGRVRFIVPTVRNQNHKWWLA